MHDDDHHHRLTSTANSNSNATTKNQHHPTNTTAHRHYHPLPPTTATTTNTTTATTSCRPPGYSRPTPIQRHAVPLALDGRADLMCCAQTGSGKTCAFLLPACAIISSLPPPPPPAQNESPARPRVLVLAPTRELASQIQHEAEKLTYASGLRSGQWVGQVGGSVGGSSGCVVGWEVYCYDFGIAQF